VYEPEDPKWKPGVTPEAQSGFPYQLASKRQRVVNKKAFKNQRKLVAAQVGKADDIPSQPSRNVRQELISLGHMSLEDASNLLRDLALGDEKALAESE
jgi:hypothetical protein